jgi:hypothetical protein
MNFCFVNTMYPLLRGLGCTSKDVAVYVIGAMLDRVSATMLAEASGFEIVRGEAFYREAGRLGYWNICARCADWERFACGEGAALGGHLDKMYEFVKSHNYGELFDNVETLAPTNVWNSLFRRCEHNSTVHTRHERFYRRIGSGAPITGLEFHDDTYLDDYMKLACAASKCGRGSEFVKWVANDNVVLYYNQQWGIARACITTDDVNMFQTLLSLTEKSRVELVIHACMRLGGMCIREYLATL